MIQRLLPPIADNRLHGHRAALWLLGLFIALKLVMGINSIFNTESVAVGADGIPLASYDPAAARDVLKLFALTSLGQLTLALVALLVLLRYRALVPLIYLVLIGEQLARRAIVQSFGGSASTTAVSINLGIFAMLAIGLLLALLPARRRQQG